MEIKEDVLIVHQVVDVSELVLPVEVRNRYEIKDINGEHLYCAVELESGHWFSSILMSLLGALRPFRLRIANDGNDGVLCMRRPFRFYFHRADVYENNVWIGGIHRRFSFVRKVFHVMNREGGLLCQIEGPFWKPWTFNIVRDGKVYGSIRKAWRGLAAEFLTDADTFGLQFPDGATSREKKVLLAAVFLIDFIYFEGNRGIDYMPTGGI